MHVHLGLPDFRMLQVVAILPKIVKPKTKSIVLHVVGFLVPSYHDVLSVSLGQ